MFFKSLNAYRLSTEWPINLEALRDQLAKKRFQPCGIASDSLAEAYRRAADYHQWEASP